MSFNYSEFEEFINKFNKISIWFNKFLFDFLTQNAIEALEKTKQRTPEDTGLLRKSWEITKVSRKGNELIVYLYNDKEYASYVEMGHSTPNGDGWVEGYYMMTISIEEVARNIPKNFEKEFAMFIKRCGVE